MYNDEMLNKAKQYAASCLSEYSQLSRPKLTP